MSQSGKREAFNRAKTSSRVIVFTRAQGNSFWSSQCQEIELLQAKKKKKKKRFSLILITASKGKLKENQGSDFS